jgi:hypothetical protein
VSRLRRRAILVGPDRNESGTIGEIAVAEDKARSALYFRRLSKVFEDLVAQGGLGMRTLALRGASPLEGGSAPILVLQSVQRSRDNHIKKVFEIMVARRATGRQLMAIKINAAVAGYGPHPEQNLAFVQVTVEFDRPDESIQRARAKQWGQEDDH